MACRMTRIPTGDQGQRFEIRSDGLGVIGWSGSRRGAERMRDAAALHPQNKRAWIIDRNDPNWTEKEDNHGRC